MKAALYLASIAAAALAVACGGGGGPSVTIPPPGSLPTWLYGYFSASDDQIIATAGQVSFVFIPDASNWDDPTVREWMQGKQIEQMQAARARGVTRFILSVGYLTFTGQYAYRGTAELAAFKERLDALDLSRSVIALYPIDEPDVAGISDATMTRAVQEIKAAWPGPKLAVIYSTKPTAPGISAYDWIGRDDYGRGAAVLDELPPIRADQRWIIVPGGANPWRQDPTPFVRFANGDSRVAVLMPFVWIDFPYQGRTENGIGSNGLAAEYCRAGQSVVPDAKCPS